ncbi:MULTISPECIES: RdgB/HAM1 family non-canonical purine NTP pyrophosphatase [unclassified Oleiphilus]|jgi:XTP/dITP diphosphohydrolase|nr:MULTISPECIES: RdgB/HAM1 family non-canonical purine NTP pyrophosphatase [unclassified Oleiphilus]KZY78123.1 non-canonical purine NTP pyrophosphatase [Oleiphilus sp. HI0068]KZY83299.1 non-canonical purine NTP pyrophosphatase [Oleiphilus sp. HI0069]KZY95926.1 non-canonical purine NTP pyrophosphatase [Oleiphilus sp. HI0072]KZZ22329.1 non-canonical purine NTP pyrophosphatase [Oleiphilus sp. HI0081]KZZ38237.1 non-canonical purine NTP pyrophosphatase [Oleiphilus sp. HI0085]
MKIVLATGNQGKLREFKLLLADHDIEVSPQSDYNFEPPEETGLSFVENAIIKARCAAKMTGLPALADDSGIAIDALQGQPGIYSARFAGEGASDQDNIDLVLKKLGGVPEAERTAQFHCVLVYMSHAEDPTPLICHGRWPGRITETQSGSEGFGYDPVFWVSDQQCTAAELTKEEKNKISHRGQATQALLDKIELIKASMA